MMLKSMREATSKDSLMDSEQSRLYISMLDQQLSQSMAARGVGLAEVMMRQLRGNLPPEIAATDRAGFRPVAASGSTCRRSVGFDCATAWRSRSPCSPYFPCSRYPFRPASGRNIVRTSPAGRAGAGAGTGAGTAGSASISIRPPTHPAITDATIPCDSVSATTDAACKRGQPGNGYTRAIHARAGSA